MSNELGSFSRLTVDKRSSVPVYQQLVAGINCIIRTAHLSENVPLPPIRLLAVELQINPNTVAKAYEELESAGVIVKRRGSGCRVAKGANKGTTPELEAALQSQIDELITVAGALGVSSDELALRIQSGLLSSGNRKSHRPEQSIKPKTSPPSSDLAVSDSGAIWQQDEDFID